MKSFVAFLVIASVAFMAHGQLAVTTCTGIANCAACISAATIPTAPFGAALACTNCTAGFYLVNYTTTCTSACTLGCNWCTNTSMCLPTGCQSNYIYNSTSGNCVACGTGVLTCNLTAGVVTAVTCNAAAGYVLNGAACSSCTNSAVTGVAIGVPNCALCSATVLTLTASTWTVFTCTQCATNYILVPIIASASTVPFCVLATTAITGTTLNGAAAAIGAALGTATAGTAVIGLGTATSPGSWGAAVFGAGPLYSFQTAPTGLWCISTPVAQAADLCTTAAIALVAAYAGAANCASGLFAATAVAATVTATVCQSCNTGFSLTSVNTCVTTVAGCTAYNATACTAVAVGYTLSAAGVATACVAGAACTGGCGLGGAALLNGADGQCRTGTQPNNCWFSNMTGVCYVCSPGYVNTAPACAACPTSCNSCTSGTVCSTGGCITGYSLASNSSCTKTVVASTNGKILFSGLGFISMILYYLF